MSDDGAVVEKKGRGRATKTDKKEFDPAVDDILVKQGAVKEVKKRGRAAPAVDKKDAEIENGVTTVKKAAEKKDVQVENGVAPVKKAIEKKDAQVENGVAPVKKRVEKKDVEVEDVEIPVKKGRGRVKGQPAPGVLKPAPRVRRGRSNKEDSEATAP